MVTFDIVSMSFSPMNGESPEMLLHVACHTATYHVCVCEWVGVSGREGVAKSINMKCKSNVSRINKNTNQHLIN